MIIVYTKRYFNSTVHLASSGRMTSERRTGKNVERRSRHRSKSFCSGSYLE